MFQGTYGEISSRIVYAAFTTPVNSIGNLPCALIAGFHCNVYPGFHCNVSSTLLPTLGRAFSRVDKFGRFLISFGLQKKIFLSLCVKKSMSTFREDN